MEFQSKRTRDIPMLKDEVYGAIKTRIIVQDMQPGSRVNEKELMTEYNIGKTPLREVFFRLQREGLIRRFPRSGTIVSPIDFTELREAAEIRTVLEGLAGELACRHITDDQVDQLCRYADLLEELIEEDLRDKFIITESRLHALLYETARNGKLVQTVTEQQSIFARMWFSVDRTAVDLAGQVRDWRNICRALRKRDPERVAKLAKGHFSTFYNAFKKLL